ncbi:MAG: hypothetical protein NWQ28_08495 [Nodularia sp. (in: cyanobacteria)]|nr:hypothetical protein [Nodularia sp. (in: cyanobacteria)]
MSLPTNHRTSHSKSRGLKKPLVCPYCQYSFPLTWRQYWAAPLGGYRCSQCGKVSHVKANSLWVWPIIITGVMVSGITSFTLALYIFNDLWIGTLFFLIGGFGVGIIIDQWMDGHLRQLEPR